jgi:hypothetical protein
MKRLRHAANKCLSKKPDVRHQFGEMTEAEDNIKMDLIYLYSVTSIHHHIMQFIRTFVPSFTQVQIFSLTLYFQMYSIYVFL